MASPAARIKTLLSKPSPIQSPKGYLSVAKEFLTPTELYTMAIGSKIMTFECGIRFLADYLNGDVYFKIHREHHNLDRCRTQFKLVADMEQKMDTMQAIVQQYSK